MKQAVLVGAVVLILAAPAAAADAPVRLTLDGRPVDHNGGVAVLRHGVVCADVIDLTRSFDGLVTLQRDGSATITIGPNTGTFRPGSLRATIAQQQVVLPVAPFRRNGDLFVPLDVFITHVAGATVHVDRLARRADIRVHSAR